MSIEKSVSALVPAYNEEIRIYDTVKAILAIPYILEVVVVDDASTDNTAARAGQAGASVITLAQNHGKGGALNTGAPELKGNIILLLDGDLGVSAFEAEKLISPIMENRADMTVARFPRARRKGGFGLVKGLARAGIKYFTGLEVEAPLSGQRAMTKQVFEQILPFESGYGVEVGLTITVARKGFRVLEIPVQMSHKETGRDLKGFIHRGKQFWHVARVLIGLRKRITSV